MFTIDKGSNAHAFRFDLAACFAKQVTFPSDSEKISHRLSDSKKWFVFKMIALQVKMLMLQIDL
tara:strand:- start:304 stop:495 length:192 start_codon:yes stop_codon:yes gene_type:complete